MDMREPTCAERIFQAFAGGVVILTIIMVLL